MTVAASAENDVVTFRVGSQWFGVSVLDVQEVLSAQRVAHVPLSPPDVEGFLNLRGQIVTAINVHQRLQITADADSGSMNVVVCDGDELFALIVDEVGDVVAVPPGALEALPATLDDTWMRVCNGVMRCEHGLLAVVDAGRLLNDSNTRP